MNRFRRVDRYALVVMAALACSPSHAEFDGRLRMDAIDSHRAGHGPLAQANATLPGFVDGSGTELNPQAELRGSVGAFHGVGTLARYDSRVNELYGAFGEGTWQWTVGRRIVSWDVGEGFRPNDLVQQEPRRPLVPFLPAGRTVAMAEYLDASSAWSVLAVNPEKARASRNAEEPALASRYYLRDGAVDWHGFARWGLRTRGSVGGAFAWVVNDATELHGSLRWLDRADTLRVDPAITSLVSTSPWQPSTVRHATKALLGGSWTGASRFGVLLEAWWDGSALADTQWDAWNARNRSLAALTHGAGVPAVALAANQAWQALAFDDGVNLRRFNLFARASWKGETWEPAINVLYAPADAGRSITASLGWQRDALRVELGVRINGGPGDAVLAQVPVRRAAYVTGSWRF